MTSGLHRARAPPWLFPGQLARYSHLGRRAGRYRARECRWPETGRIAASPACCGYRARCRPTLGARDHRAHRDDQDVDQPMLDQLSTDIATLPSLTKGEPERTVSPSEPASPFHASPLIGTLFRRPNPPRRSMAGKCSGFVQVGVNPGTAPVVTPTA
jgi:hypothetical protein